MNSSGSLNYKWARPLWEEIEEFISVLKPEVDHESIIKFLSYVESKIKCGKCKIHFRNFPRPEIFSTKNQVENWFRELNKDVKKQKTKANPQNSNYDTHKSNRFTKFKPINKLKRK